MEIQQLRYFVAVSELRSFTKAALRCGVSQPSLSQQIQKLERELGQQLLDRFGRKLRLTEAGQAFYERSAAILDAVEPKDRAYCRDVKRAVPKSDSVGVRLLLAVDRFPDRVDDVAFVGAKVAVLIDDGVNVLLVAGRDEDRPLRSKR